MDTYRALHSPHRDCVSWEYLPRIQKVGQPALDIDSPLIHRLQERSSYLFFPESEIRDIFGAADVHKIIECSCGTCQEGKVTRNLAERGGLVDRLQERKLTILLAILVYIGHPYLFSWVALDSRVSDENLDAVTTFLRRDDNIKTSKEKIMLEDVEDFAGSIPLLSCCFSLLRSRWEAQRSHMGNGTECRFSTICPMIKALPAKSASLIFMRII